MLAPKLSDLASEYSPRLLVIKCDVEETPANRTLASLHGISAFPTLHVYSNSIKLEEIRGANLQAIRAAIVKHMKPKVPPMARQLATALGHMKSALSSSNNDEFVLAATTLLRFIENLVDHPVQEKYRRIRAGNKGFHDRLGSKPHAEECMKTLGFQLTKETGDNGGGAGDGDGGEMEVEDVWVVESPNYADLADVRILLKEAISLGGGEGGGASQPPTRTTTTTAIATTTAPATNNDNTPPVTAEQLGRILEQVLGRGHNDGNDNGDGHNNNGSGNDAGNQ
jgi:hypothetical protein